MAGLSHHRRAQGNPTAKVPGSSDRIRTSGSPDMVVDCEGESAEAGARRVVALLVEKGYIR